MVSQKTIEVERLDDGFLLSENGKRHAHKGFSGVMNILKMWLGILAVGFLDKEHKRMYVKITVEIDEPVDDCKKD